MPTTSTGTSATAMVLHLAGVKPDEATIFTRGKPAASSCSRMCQIAAAETQVPTRWRSSASLR